jgi:hypothetical protein
MGRKLEAACTGKRHALSIELSSAIMFTIKMSAEFTSRLVMHIYGHHRWRPRKIGLTAIPWKIIRNERKIHKGLSGNGARRHRRLKGTFTCGDSAVINNAGWHLHSAFIHAKNCK